MQYHLTEQERKVIDYIGDKQLTADYVQRWISDGAPAFAIEARQKAWGFYWAVFKMIERGMIKAEFYE